MQDWVLRECLQQLTKVYVYAEQQYVHSAIETRSPFFEVFYHQRAFERSDFILQMGNAIDALDSCENRKKSLEMFFDWHDVLYGRAGLNQWPVTDIEVFNIDEKALEICNCLLNDPIPESVYRIIEHHAVRLESSLVSLAYLKSLYK